jgi:hypothetical protein
MNLHTLNLPQPPQPSRLQRVLRALANPFGWPFGEPVGRDGELFVVGRPGYHAIEQRLGQVAALRGRR